MFYLGDANYNVTEVVQYNVGSGTWQVAERYSYDPYGKVTVYDTSSNPIAGNQSQAGIDNTIFYAGETFDSSTGLYYDRAGITILSWAGSLAKTQWGTPAAVSTCMFTAATTRRMRRTRPARSCMWSSQHILVRTESGS